MSENTKELMKSVAVEKCERNFNFLDFIKEIRKEAELGFFSTSIALKGKRDFLSVYRGEHLADYLQAKGFDAEYNPSSRVINISWKK